jgi:hypothetical protein
VLDSVETRDVMDREFLRVVPHQAVQIHLTDSFPYSSIPHIH